MAKKFGNKYRIESTRLQNWDYRWDARYFITICTAKQQHFFGHIENEKMYLSHIGVIADIFWYEIKNHAKNVMLDEFVVMPNHIHGILILDGNGIENDNANDGNNNGDDGDNGNDNDNGNGVGNGVGNVETRHALSLQPPTQPPTHSPTPPEQTIGNARFQNQGKNTVSSIVGGYKSAVTKHAHRLGFGFAWQPRFYDHIIRDDESYWRIKNYIKNNPKNWTDDKFNDEK